MKNFTLLWRSLTMATLLLCSIGLSAQIDCGVNRANISIQVNNTCSESNIPQHPYITIDFGPGSGNLNGTAIINVRPFFSGPLTLTDVSNTVEVSFGIATFQLDPSAFLLPGVNNTIQLLDVNFVDIGCSQDFSTGTPVVSNPYILGPNSTLTVTDDVNRNIVPPCQGVPTGRLSLRVTPGDGDFSDPNRFDVRILPDTLSTLISVSSPGTFPNTTPGSNYYIVETNQSLTIGDYTFLLFDKITDCEVAYDVSLGDPNAQFMVELSATPVSCFDDNDGTITVDVSQADPATNGTLTYSILDGNGAFVNGGTLTAPTSAGYAPDTKGGFETGTYTVNLAAGNGGCMSTGTVTVGTPLEVTAAMVSADSICASAIEYTIEVEDLEGITGQDVFDDVYYIVDSRAASCWDGNLSTTPIAASDDYSLTIPVPAALGCFDPSQDFTVPLTLRVFQDGNPGCSESFNFDLFVKATPPTPEVVAYTIDGLDSLASRLCSGADIELLVTNYDEDLTYNVAIDGVLPNGVIATGAFGAPFEYTGVASGTITNNTNSAVFIDYNVTATYVDDQVSCDSEVETVTIVVRPQPFLTPFPAGTATDTVCSGTAYSSPNVRLNGSNGTSGGNGNIRWNYEWDVPADLTYSGGLALSAEGLMNNATTGGFAFENNTTSQQVATLTITPIFPQMIQTLSGATVADTCFGTPYQIALTVEPVTDLEVEANGTFAANLNSQSTPTITVCNNSDVVFNTEFFGVAGARYKIARILTGAPNVTNGNFGPLDAETRNLDDDFTETLRNSGTTTETVVYEFRSYTYGPNGVDGGFDDCIGESLKIAVEVLPAITNESVVMVDAVTANGSAYFSNESVCSFDQIAIDLSSSLNSGEFRYEWTRTVAGGDIIGLDALNASGSVPDFGGSGAEITQELATGGNSSVTVTYAITAVTPGPNGFFGGGDDCDGGDEDIVTIIVEPTPVLSFNLNGMAITGDTAITICSGDDFLIDGLAIPQTPSATDNFLKYVNFNFAGDASFLDVNSGDIGVYSINNFQLGANGVVNTSPNNSFQFTQLVFTPYFENQNNTTTSFDECEGASITVTVIINPAVPNILAQDETLCSGEELSSPVVGGTGSGTDLLTILSGEETFSAQNTEFVVPPGANSIANIAFGLDGANGGAATNAANNGGVGYHFDGVLNEINTTTPQPGSLPVQPGDTIRVVLGASGADGINAGNGGDASTFIVYAGPNSAQPAGSIVHAFVAAGGGGAGANNGGQNAFNVQTSLGSPTDGVRGASFGGFGGLGFDNGYTGGAGVSQGGGGGGGYSGGDGGGNPGAEAGQAGTSLNFGPLGINGRQKNGNDGVEGSAFMSYIIVFDDVNFTLVDKVVAPGLIDLDPSNVTPGTTMGADTLLYGEAFSNPTNGPLTVSYELTTTTEAGCGDAGSFTYTLTVEPNVTGYFESGSTDVTEVVANESYTATICSGDSLSTFLNSDVVPSSGSNGSVYFFVENIDNPAGLNIVGNDLERASATFAELSGAQPFGGNNGNAPFPIFFYEGGIQNFTGEAATITYTIASRIFNPMEDDCEGTSFTLAVTVLPGFDNANITVPGAFDLCSGTSLADAGLDFGTIYDTVANDPDFDMIRIIDFDVDLLGGDATLFDTISGPALEAGDSLTVSVAEFEAYTFDNKTADLVEISFEVRLVSADGCISEAFTLDFNSRAEPIIAAPANNIIRDTICSGDLAGYEIMAAPNSASAAFFPPLTNGRVRYYYEADVPTGLDTLGGLTATSYPTEMELDNNLIADDQFRNRTGSALTVTYRVAATATDFGCGSDTVTFALVVEPEPSTDVMLVAGDSIATYGLFNARRNDPNPVFEICANEAITTTLVNTAVAASGDVLTARVIITDPDDVTRFDLNSVTGDSAIFVIPASELADSLTFAANELVNTGTTPLTFTVSYFTFFNNPGSPNCGGSGVTEFDVTVLPSRTARITIPGPISQGDTLCSGAAFNLRFRDDANTAGVVIDSFQVEVIAPGLTPEMGTETGTFAVDGPNNFPYNTNLNGIAYVNPSAGVKSVRYVARPYSSDGCLGLPDTVELFYLPETVLNSDIPLICGVDGVSTAITPVDSNLQVLSTDRQEYRFEYIGGTASGFSIEPSVGGAFFFVANPAAQANSIVLNNQATIVLTPGAGFTPGEVRFEVIYDNTDTGCGTITDTIVVNYSTEANPGTLDPSLDILCDGENFLLTDALIGESEGGVFTDANGDPVGSLNFTPMIGGSDPTPVTVDFTYTVGGGNSGCPVASTTFSLMVEPAPNAGTLNTMADNEACQAALAFNLFDLIDGAMSGGSFTQTAGVDFVAVASDGVFDQNSITAGTYVFEYEVVSANGCGSDLLSGITVEVLSQTECSTVVPCDTINLFAGFNVISFDALPADVSVENIFADEIAADNLLSIFSINPATGSSEVYSFNPVFGTTSNGIGGIQDGLGYIVEVANATQIITCGVAGDPDLRVELISGLNIVGYTAQMSQEELVYFDELISAGDLNSIVTVDKFNQDFLRATFNPLNGDIINMNNSQGYLLDVSAAYAPNSWRDGAQMPTSEFDRLFGYTNIPAEYAGQSIRFQDADGNVFGKAMVSAEGTFDNVILFGDLPETERLVEGLSNGEEIYAEFRGETIATGMTFAGNWNLRQLDLTFTQVTTATTTTELPTEFAMSVFPNPTDGMVNMSLDLEANYEFVRVEVYGTLGQLVAERQLMHQSEGRISVELDLQKLASGTYNVLVITDTGVKGRSQVIRK